MLKIFLIVAAITICAFALLAMVYSMIVAGRSGENENNGDRGKGDGHMFWNKKICSRCKTGKETYELDPQSDVCPYIGCLRRNKCHFYKPLDKESKRTFERNSKQAKH